MNKLKQWFKTNVLQKETKTFNVYYKYRTSKGYKIIKLKQKARSKTEAKVLTQKFISTHAVNSKNYKFLKVEQE